MILAAVAFAPETARSLLVLALGAFLLPLASRPLRLPAAVGEILFGVLVGSQVLGLVVVTDFIRLLGEVGFFLLMFLAGLELDFRQLEKGGWALLMEGLAVAGLFFVLGFAVAAAQGWPFFLALAVAVTSIGVPLVLLHETGLGQTAFGQRVLLVGSVGEYASILLATAVAAYFHTGGINRYFAVEVLKLVGVFTMAYLFLLVLRTAVWWRPEWFARLVETRDSSEIGVRAGLALMFVFVAVTATLGIDPILGAFLAGSLFSFVFRDKGPLEAKFLSLGNGFFIPFFFITVGLRFDVGEALSGEPVVFFHLLLALFGVRWCALLLLRRSGFDLRQITCGALVLSAPLTLLVVVADLGRRLERIDPATQSTILLLAVVSSTLFPFLFKGAARRIPAPPVGTNAR